MTEASADDQAAEPIDSPAPFHALVTDIHGPGKRDGIAVGRHVRARHPLLPIVCCTGRLDAMNGAGPLGACDVLVRKPYVPSQVVAVLQRFPCC